MAREEQWKCYCGFTTSDIVEWSEHCDNCPDRKIVEAKAREFSNWAVKGFNEWFGNMPRY